MTELEMLLTDKEMPFEAAVEHFGNRVTLTAKQFYRLLPKYRSLAFSVSGYTSAQILSKFYSAVLDAIENGTSMDTFRREMSSFLEDEGYCGLTPFQSDNIFRTNVQTAYNVGHYEEMTDPKVKALRPYWQYDAVHDRHTRPSHLAMDGKVFPADSPVWDTWYPPNGFRCRCTVRTLSERQVQQRGLTVEQSVPRGEELPDGRFVSMQPDPNFDSNPAKMRWAPDLSGMPKPLAEAYLAREAKKSTAQR